MNKKILFVVSEDWYFCSHRLPIAIAAKKVGYEVVLATNISDHKNLLDSHGIRTVPLKFMKRSSINILREICLFIELLVIIKLEKPQIIHNVSLKLVIYSSFCSKIIGKGFLVNALGGLGIIFTNNNLSTKLLRFIILRFLRVVLNFTNSSIIVQNQFDFAYINRNAKVNKEKIKLICGAGVDLEKFSADNQSSDKPIVMLASRLIREKGIFEFVEASNILRVRGYDFRFVIVGKPDLGAKSFVPEHQIKLWVQYGLVEWWGYFMDMSKIIPQASIVCLPSYYGEGLPKILIEAMACYKPVITTSIPGCSSVVRDGVNGILISPKNPKELANSIENLLINHSLRKSMGIEGRRIAERKYDVNDVIKKTLSIYKIAENK